MGSKPDILRTYVLALCSFTDYASSPSSSSIYAGWEVLPCSLAQQTQILAFKPRRIVFPSVGQQEASFSFPIIGIHPNC